MVLQELLNLSKRDYDQLISKLEHLTGNQALDIRLNLLVLRQTNTTIEQLGLDVADTTVEEMYHALMARAVSDSRLFARRIGISPKNSIEKRYDRIIKAVLSSTKHRHVYGLQASALKQLLKDVPPKKTLKILKLRSIDAVLKRESPIALYALARMVEDKTWHTQVSARLKRMKTNQAKMSSVKIAVMPISWLEKIPAGKRNAVCMVVQELGSVILLPHETVMRDIGVLCTACWILETIDKLECGMIPHHADIFAARSDVILTNMFQNKTMTLPSIVGIQPSWETVRSVYAQSNKDSELVSEIVGNRTSSLTALTQLYGDFAFWEQSAVSGYPVLPHHHLSCNLLDVLHNAVIGTDLPHSTSAHLMHELNLQLEKMYFSHHVLERRLIEELNLVTD